MDLFLSGRVNRVSRATASPLSDALPQKFHETKDIRSRDHELWLIAYRPSRRSSDRDSIRGLSNNSRETIATNTGMKNDNAG
ncbi:hypothetical protein OE88DRAFT_1655643 [Heliocybe sulcata]|uniref:Uncharacterized protein n=1 Tax=Heliocybe sulcata TaxID=5364 RepID=A0A5C3NAK8_9AGAM|nr:hypothetical protein OE88DRAFT_1655643 [Heliocybe sulcata]